jgi:hypothetical protein
MKRLAFVLLFFVGACVPLRPVPQVARSFSVACAPEGALGTIDLDAPASQHAAATCTGGQLTFQLPPQTPTTHGSTIILTADGFATFRGRARTPATAVGRLQIHDLATDTVMPEPVALQRLPRGRTGLVRLEGRAFADDGGPYLAVGATLFWAHWGYLHDRAKLEHELEKLSGQVDYIRTFAVCFWDERVVTADEVLAGDSVQAFTDWVYERYRLRVEWTVFADGRGSADEHAAVIRRVGALLGDRGDKVQHYELTNEGPITGWTSSELTRLAAQLRGLVPNAVATTAVDLTGEAVAAWYDGSQANLATVHLQRDVRGEGGMWRPIRQARDVPLVWRGAWTSNEPIGPKSTVAEDDDPLRLVMSAAVAWLCNAAGYVYHTGAGQTAGASYDVARGRETTLWDVPNIDATLAGLTAVRTILPPDLANWSLQNNNARAGADHPFVTTPTLEQAQVDGRMLRAFAAVNGPRFVVMPLVVREPLAFQAKQAMTFGVFDPLTAAKREHVELAAGETYMLQPTDAAIFVGENR